MTDFCFTWELHWLTPIASLKNVAKTLIQVRVDLRSQPRPSTAPIIPSVGCPIKPHSGSTSSSSSTGNRKSRLSLSAIHSSIHTCATQFPWTVPDISSVGTGRRTQYPVGASYQSRALTRSSIYFSYKLRPTFNLRSRFPLHMTPRKMLRFFFAWKPENKVVLHQ